MFLNANQLSTNILVTVLVAVLVFLLPWLDRRTCARLGVDLRGGLSSNPRADALLRLRQALLLGVFFAYLLVFAYLVFFSRSASAEHLVHIAPFEDLQKAINSDFGLSDLLVILFTEGLQKALSHIRVVKFEDITQVYMNVMLYVPMGYLLPYVFETFRARAKVRPVLACLLISFAVENLQLIFKRGFYDMDDLLANTLGGLLGQTLFLSVAYVLTHPDWRRELFALRLWKRNARRSAFYPYARKLGPSRTTLLGTDEEEVHFFYVTKLGFRPRGQLNERLSFGTNYLFELGSTQLEIRCSNMPDKLPAQYLTLSVPNLSRIRKRLRRKGINPGPFELDPYTELRRMSFTGPDGVVITVIEA